MHTYIRTLVDKLLPFCYSPSPPIAVYALGVVTNITIATHRDGQCESMELVEVGRMVTDVCLLTDSSKWKRSVGQPLSPFKVFYIIIILTNGTSMNYTKLHTHR